MSLYAPRDQAPDASPTIAHGLRVLRAFRSNRAPLSNAELVRRTGMSKAAVSRFTSTLLHLGYLRHVPGSRSFELTADPFGVGDAFVATSDMLKTSVPIVQGLANSLGVAAALAQGDQLEMLYVAYHASRPVAALRLNVGSLLPMGSTAIGHAYLFGLPPRQRTPLIDALKRETHGNGAALERSIRASFAELQATGTCGVQSLPGTYSVAAPLFVGRERRVMALACGKAGVRPDLEVERQRIAPALKEAAARLEALLAACDGPP